MLGYHQSIWPHADKTLNMVHQDWNRSTPRLGSRTRRWRSVWRGNGQQIIDLTSVPRATNARTWLRVWPLHSGNKEKNKRCRSYCGIEPRRVTVAQAFNNDCAIWWPLSNQVVVPRQVFWSAVGYELSTACLCIEWILVVKTKTSRKSTEHGDWERKHRINISINIQFESKTNTSRRHPKHITQHLRWHYYLFHRARRNHHLFMYINQYLLHHTWMVS